MQYTTLDINSLKMKMLIILIGLAFIYSLLYLVFTMLVPYNLTIRKQKDVFLRRVLFFAGMFSLFSAAFLYLTDMLINTWRPNMEPESEPTIVSSLMSFAPIACAASLILYILNFWLCAKFLRGFIGYKPWTVFVSKGKKFGLF